MKSALSVPELVMEINSRTLVRLLSERLPKQGRRVLGLLLSGCSPEMTARMLGTGVRQVWLAADAETTLGYPDRSTAI